MIHSVRASMLNHALATIFLALSLQPYQVSAQTQRSRLIEAYKANYTGHRPIYQAAPVTHVVPEFNTVTYVIDARSYAATVKNPDTPTSGESLMVRGYKVSPYLALSLKKFGLGFNVESGEMTIDFARDSGGTNFEQTSHVTHRALGIFGFFKLIDSKMYDLTLIGGGRTYNATHKINQLHRSDQTAYDASYRYVVNQYEAGMNHDLHLLRSITLTPWANYTHIDTANATAQIKTYDGNADDMSEDLDVFWRSRRSVDYGLDLSLRVKGLEVRLGGLLGVLFTSAGGSPWVTDKGYSLSLSLHHKG